MALMWPSTVTIYEETWAQKVSDTVQNMKLRTKKQTIEFQKSRNFQSMYGIYLFIHLS